MLKSLQGLQGKRVLLLQGPMGPFFRRLSRDMRQVGAEVFKVNFNGGDWLFYPTGAMPYRGTMEAWPAFLERLIQRLSIDTVVLFGDCRPVHVPAHELAHRLGLDVWVFEEGYLRPDYITLERFGVNAHSLIPRSPLFYLNTPLLETVKKKTRPVGNSFWFAALWSFLYYFAAGLLWPLFRHYRHHRPLNWLEALCWGRGVWRKLRYRLSEAGVMARLRGDYAGRFFLVPLQVHNDAQVEVHSEYSHVQDFIEDVIRSFSTYAPEEVILVIKHHPLDRAYHDYRRFIRRQARKFGVGKRVYYIHDQHLPTLLQISRGVVVINSTVGRSALSHNAPLKVCGDAIYDMKGLTFQGTLDQFWDAAPEARPDRRLYDNFVSYLINSTQINGNFYRRLPGAEWRSGVKWEYGSPLVGSVAEDKLREALAKRLGED